MHWVRNFFIWFVLHTVAVYMAALEFCPSLVGHTFRWLLPIFHANLGISAGDWYLQHLIAITMIPTLLGGYLGARFVNSSAAFWAWLVPVVVMAGKLLTFHSGSSVLMSSQMSGLKYYFDIQPIMPNRSNFLSVDPMRVVQQMTVTAPFLAGEAYTLGASLAVLLRRRSREFTLDEAPGETQDIRA